VPQWKLRRAFQKLQCVYLFKNCLILKLRRNLKLNKSGGACMSASILLWLRHECPFHIEIICWYPRE
jgi:hypothetical protein